MTWVHLPFALILALNSEARHVSPASPIRDVHHARLKVDDVEVRVIAPAFDRVPRPPTSWFEELAEHPVARTEAQALLFAYAQLRHHLVDTGGYPLAMPPLVGSGIDPSVLERLHYRAVGPFAERPDTSGNLVPSVAGSFVLEIRSSASSASAVLMAVDAPEDTEIPADLKSPEGR